MSIIERALQRLKQEAAAAPAERAKPPEPPYPPAGHQAEPRVDRPPQVKSADVIRPMPCRSERVVRIDLPTLRAAGVMPPENEERRLAEEYRAIKRPLLKTMTGDDVLPLSNVVVVTSAVPGEGKTFTAINLALSLALERNREVVLVDGDVAKRHITHLFRLNDEPGLLDAAGTAGRHLEDVIVRTDLPSLYVLPAGSESVEATEILRSERLSALLASLASEPRRIVLIDSSPLLLTSEAGVLAALAGQVIVVVKASGTPQEAVVRAVESIREDKPVSFVLNQADLVPERGYGYYGEYGYGRSYGSNTTESPGGMASGS